MSFKSSFIGIKRRIKDSKITKIALDLLTRTSVVRRKRRLGMMWFTKLFYVSAEGSTKQN